MIENLRKYTGLIIVFFVLVLIGFIFMDTSTMRSGSGGGAPYIKVAGRTYTDKEFGQLGDSAFKVAQTFMQSGDFQLYSFILSMIGNADSQKETTENFFTSRMLLRSAKEEFGIHPGEEEIDSFIRKLRIFTGPNGEFSMENYRNFIEKGIGRLGLTEGDIRDLASDVIAQEKLAEILGAGLSANRDSVAKISALEDQRISLEVARIDIAPLEAKIDPSEEAIKAYWETSKDAFKTAEKRSFTYLTVKPTIPAAPAEIPAPAADASAEAKAEYEKTKAAREASIAEARRKAMNESDAKADDFLFDLGNEKELTFEKLAEKNNLPTSTTELFPLAEAPAALKAALRSTSTPGTAADQLFQMIVTSDPLSKISPAIAIGEDEWLIARLDKIEEIRVKTYEEARSEARARLIAEEAGAALKKATGEAMEKIKPAIAAGKTFSEATKEAGITIETVNLTQITTSYQGDSAKVPNNLFENAKYTEPGALTEPIFEADRAFIIHVKAREIVKQPNADDSLKAEFERAQNSIRISAFSSWLTTRTEAAGVETLYNK